MSLIKLAFSIKKHYNAYWSFIKIITKGLTNMPKCDTTMNSSKQASKQASKQRKKERTNSTFLLRLKNCIYIKLRFLYL